MNRKNSENHSQNERYGFSKLIASEYWRDLPAAEREKVLVQLAEYKGVHITHQ